MRKKTEKTAEQRARELYAIVHGPGRDAIGYFDRQNPLAHDGWCKLARCVLALEKKKKGRKG